jgi:hypothetical protein
MAQIRHIIIIIIVVVVVIVIMALLPFDGPWPHCQFLDSILLGQGINPLQGFYLHTEQHKHRINAHSTNIHALSSI